MCTPVSQSLDWGAPLCTLPGPPHVHSSNSSVACTHAGSSSTVASIAAEMSEVQSYESSQSAAKGKIYMTIIVIVYRTYATTRQTHDVQHTVAWPHFSFVLRFQRTRTGSFRPRLNHDLEVSLSRKRRLSLLLPRCARSAAVVGDQLSICPDSQPYLERAPLLLP
jgi:hypothetical protein